MSEDDQPTDLDLDGALEILQDGFAHYNAKRYIQKHPIKNLRVKDRDMTDSMPNGSSFTALSLSLLTILGFGLLIILACILLFLSIRMG